MSDSKPSRYKTDPVFRKRQNELVKKRHEHRMATEPKYAARQKQWMRDYQKKYYKEQYRRDPQYRGKMLSFGRFHRMFGVFLKIARSETVPLFGCSIMELAAHIERQWEAGMNWANYGSAWTIDHINPTGAFDLTTEDGVHSCWHYSNLRPLGAVQNIRKGGLSRVCKPE